MANVINRVDIGGGRELVLYDDGQQVIESSDGQNTAMGKSSSYKVAPGIAGNGEYTSRTLGQTGDGRTVVRATNGQIFGQRGGKSTPLSNSNDPSPNGGARGDTPPVFTPPPLRAKIAPATPKGPAGSMSAPGGTPTNGATPGGPGQMQGLYPGGAPQAGSSPTASGPVLGPSQDDLQGGGGTGLGSNLLGNIHGAAPQAQDLLTQYQQLQAGGNPAGGTFGSPILSAYGIDMTQDLQHQGVSDPDMMLSLFADQQGWGYDSGSIGALGDAAQQGKLMGAMFSPGQTDGEIEAWQQQWLTNLSTPGGPAIGARDVANRMMNAQMGDPVFNMLHSDNTPAGQADAFNKMFVAGASLSMPPEVLGGYYSYLKQQGTNYAKAVGTGEFSGSYADYLRATGSDPVTFLGGGR